jgi:hypothetical protein
MTCLSFGITPKTRCEDPRVEFEMTRRVFASAISLREVLLAQRHFVGRYPRCRNACAEGFASTIVFGLPLTVVHNIYVWKSAEPINGKFWRLLITARLGDLWYFQFTRKGSMTARVPAFTACKGSPMQLALQWIAQAREPRIRQVLESDRALANHIPAPDLPCETQLKIYRSMRPARTAALTPSNEDYPCHPTSS